MIKLWLEGTRQEIDLALGFCASSDEHGNVFYRKASHGHALDRLDDNRANLRISDALYAINKSLIQPVEIERPATPDRVWA